MFHTGKIISGQSSKNQDQRRSGQMVTLSGKPMYSTEYGQVPNLGLILDCTLIMRNLFQQGNCLVKKNDVSLLIRSLLENYV